MPAPPSFDLFPGDLIKSTTVLSPEAFGSYVRLMCHQWEHGHIPAKMDSRMRICGVLSHDVWVEIWGEIGDRFEACDEAGNMVQLRLSKQREKTIAIWQARKEGGKKGGRPRKNKGETKPQGLGEGSPGKTSLEDGRRKKEVIPVSTSASTTSERSDACNDRVSSEARNERQEAIQEVWEFYLRADNHSGSMLTDERRKMISKRLKEGYTVAQLCKAIEGLHLTPHNQGATNGTKYLDLRFCIGDAERVERNWKAADNPPRQMSERERINQSAGVEFVNDDRY